MKTYRYTSANYVLPGESGDADAFIDPTELTELKKLAGIVTEETWGLQGAVGGNMDNVPNVNGTNDKSPVGSNISFTAAERRSLEKKYHAQPGTDLWFIINFTKPFFNGSLESKVEEYLKQHPEYRPRSFPNGN